MPGMTSRSILSTLALLLSGCAPLPTDTGGAYPSLARRPVERSTSDAPAAAPAPQPVQAADPALEARVAQLSSQASAGAAAFEKDYPAAARAARAASSTSVSSEPWVAAQTAISSLETARNDSVSALASLDTLYIEQSNAIADGKAITGLDAIDAARRAALAIVDAQNDRIDALKAMLPQA